jgi:hypothetical protein
MGIPLTIFSLYRLEGDDGGCAHPLLLRVHQPGFSNADAAEYDAAFAAAEARRQALIATHASDGLARECAGPHTARLVGELQARPVGEALAEGPGGTDVELWMAQTRFGAPWVVLGTAEDEDAFWRGIEEDDDLSGLGPIRPAERLRAYFIADTVLP